MRATLKMTGVEPTHQHGEVSGESASYAESLYTPLEVSITTRCESLASSLVVFTT